MVGVQVLLSDPSPSAEESCGQPLRLDRDPHVEGEGRLAKCLGMADSLRHWVCQLARRPVGAAASPVGRCVSYRVNHSTRRSTFPSLPLLDELRTYCYEHRIEEIPVLLAV
jgi:hypothetical protein